ncbi:hypothetical protein [Planktotalea sp.]|uniref:hypothetical protein n=1 Tax=Planktotalea sp. TaxID=2029877 RepID=UPI003D6B3D33
MNTFIPIAVVLCIVALFALKSYAESCLPWKHPLNLLLNGNPKEMRNHNDPGARYRNGTSDGSFDSGDGSC